MPLTVACGQCVGCRLERSRVWAVRCMDESSLYSANVFITLTYDNEHLPPDNGLHYRDFQLFMKRLRNKYGDGIRFYMCGEYGELRGRPHFHALLFNFDFPDKYKWCMRKKLPSFRSPTLDGLPRGAVDRSLVDPTCLWPNGHAEIGSCTFESAAYIARYIMKKQLGKDAAATYEWPDPVTGEIHDRRPEFTNMSRRPGIGKEWIEKFVHDVYPHDFKIVNGRKTKPPRYYDKHFEALDPLAYEDLKWGRELAAQLRADDNTPERLAVREQVAQARVSQLKRTLK